MQIIGEAIGIAHVEASPLTRSSYHAKKSELVAAEKITPEIINFMATNGKGLICAPISEERCQELDLELMTGKNTALHQTAFTISVDLIGNNSTTGISSEDRAKTIKALVNDKSKPEDFARPGHIFPLKSLKVLLNFPTSLSLKLMTSWPFLIKQ